MFDLHSHILPGIDDGARSARESGAMLKQLFECGFSHVALTPHFYPAKNSVAHFTEAREKAYRELQKLPEAGKFSFILGAEVYLTESLFNVQELAPLCYENTSFVLVEFSERESFSAAQNARLERLMAAFNVTPVIAHIDRYPYLLHKSGNLATLRAMGCALQMNLDACFDWRKKRAARRLLQDGRIDFLGNDLHRPSLVPADDCRRLEKLKKKVGAGALAEIEAKSAALFESVRSKTS